MTHFICLVYLSTCIIVINYRTCLHPAEANTAYSMPSKCGPTILMYTISKPTKVTYMCMPETSAKWRAFQTSLCTYRFLADSEVSLKCSDEIFNLHCELFNFVFLGQVVHSRTRLRLFQSPLQ